MESDEEIFKDVIAFYAYYYAKEKDKIDPDFADLCDIEKERIIKEEMKLDFRIQTGKHNKKSKNHISENIKIILQRS